jgi:protein-tyrosine sulfotransferase
MRMARPIFILSNFRTGSTLLRFALDAHPNICCPAELRLGALCQCLYRTVELLTTAESMPEGTDLLAVRVATVRGVVDGLMAVYCHRKGKDHWCEKSPANAEILYVLSSIFPDARFICLHRNALDQSSSLIEMDPRLLHPYLQRNSGDIVSSALDRWCTITERLLAFEHEASLSSLRILYEDLVEDPEREVGRVLQFLDLPEVEGLHVLAFQKRHDSGPRDSKIKLSKTVGRDRVGAGRLMDLSRVSEALRARTTGLANAVGYSAVDSVPFAPKAPGR